MRALDYIRGNVPGEIKYILLLFLGTRIALTIIGVSSRIILESGTHAFFYFGNLLLDIWGVWDTLWYMRIAERGYLTLEYFGFFPLYSLLMRVLGYFIGNLYVAGILLSNVSLIIACIFLYKLVRLESDEHTALRSIKYLFLFPTAFILSGVFSESLFLALIIICFYYARRGRWFLVGVSGFFLSLTRPIGVFMVLPLLYEYLKAKDFRLKKIRIDMLFLILIPLGLFTFTTYAYYVTGDFLAYPHVKQIKWGYRLSNPLKILYENLFTPDISKFSNGVFAITAILMLSLFYRKIGFSYWLQGMLVIFVSLMSGSSAMTGISRYLLLVFPLYIIFARLSENHSLDQVITIILALLQGFLMVFWTNGFTLTI